AAALRGTDLITDPDVLAALSHDEAEWATVGNAVGALRARSTDEVSAAVAACADLRGPIVPRGAGTGLSRGGNGGGGALRRHSWTYRAARGRDRAVGRREGGRRLPRARPVADEPDPVRRRRQPDR